MIFRVLAASARLFASSSRAASFAFFLDFVLNIVQLCCLPCCYTALLALLLGEPLSTSPAVPGGGSALSERKIGEFLKRHQHVGSATKSWTDDRHATAAHAKTVAVALFYSYGTRTWQLLDSALL